MKKILTGFLGLFLVIGIVAGAGYAVFSSKATMTGMVLGTATPGLKISFVDKTDPLWRDYQTTLDFFAAGKSFQKLLPGETDWGAFYVRNDSIAGNPTETYDDPLDLSLTGRITSALGDWGKLDDVIQMRVCLYDGTSEDRCDLANKTSWMTLASWNIAETTLPGGILHWGDPLGEERLYVVNFYIPSSYGNEIMNLTITDMVMSITGTQVLY